MIDKTHRSIAVLSTPAPSAGAKASAPERAAPAVAHPFAEMLRQNRLAASATRAAARGDATIDTPARTPSTSASEDTTPAEPAAPSRTPRDAAQARARAAGDDPASSPADEAAPASDAATKMQDGDPKAGAGGKDASMPTADPASNAVALANAHAAVLRAPAAAAASAASDASTGTDDSGRDGGNAGGITTLALPTSSAQDRAATGATARADATLAAADAADEHRAATDGDAAAASGSASFVAMLAESKSTHGATAPATHNAFDTPAPAGVSNGVNIGSAANATAAAAPTSLATPLHSAEFATAFGMQVSVLAKDGVQRAELHLNPAEMGPVSIRISLDGTQARVDFGADVAATRQAIEAGLPELASALRDAGFTLAGGGVAQHSASNGGGQDDDAPSRTGGTAPPRISSAQAMNLDVAAQRLARRAAAGGVDLYA